MTITQWIQTIFSRDFPLHLGLEFASLLSAEQPWSN
jgi:hypothetical protein